MVFGPFSVSWPEKTGRKGIAQNGFGRHPVLSKDYSDNIVKIRKLFY
jgi:hypothetical protein